MKKTTGGGCSYWVWVTAFVWCLLPRAALAQSLQYSAIDRATVRVLALGPVDLQEIEIGERKFRLASPIGGHGSGFVAGKDGLIVTAAHVVADARAVAVHAPGVLGPLAARVVAIDETRDVALLRVAHTFDAPAAIAPAGENLAIRQTVFAIGYPVDVTRADPQSSRGSVSGLLPDGRLQLDISVNPGNSGGPVVDEKDRVFGIVSARGNVSKGIVGLGVAVPIDAFRAQLQTEAEKHVEAAPDRAQMADLVSVVAHDGAAMMRGSLDDNSELRSSAEREVRRLLETMPDSADATLVGSAFFWNRHVADQARDNKSSEALAEAERLARRAAELEPALKTKSAFVKFMLGSDKEAVISSDGGKIGGSGHTVHFQNRQKDTSLFVKKGEATATSGLRSITINAYEKLCDLPCDVKLPSGNYLFAIKQGSRDLVPVSGVVNLSGPATLETEYRSNSGVRGAGVAVLVISAAVSVGLILTNKGTECPTNSYGVSTNCTNDDSGLIWGGIVGGVGGLLGAVLISRPDTAVVGPHVFPNTPRTAGLALRDIGLRLKF